MQVEITLTDEERERWAGFGPLVKYATRNGLALADLVVIDGRVVKAAGVNLDEAQAAWDARKAAG